MRKNTALMAKDSYTPNHLLDTLMAKLDVKSDAALARALEVPPSTISKVRHRQMAVNSALLLAAHEATEISIHDLRLLLGDTGSRYWLGGLAPAERAIKLPSHVERMHRDTSHGGTQIQAV